jgi:kynurenine formamidase
MERRVLFDFEIEFANGGGLKGEGFRLDIQGEDVADDELADYLVRDMRLLMVESVRILKKAVIDEPHKRARATVRPPVILDVSHVVEDGFVSYKGLPPPVIRDYMSHVESRPRYAPGTEFQIGRIEMVGNTGTYVDSPFHRYPAGRDVSELPLTSLAALDGVVIRVPPGVQAVSHTLLSGHDLEGRAVLLHTGWDSKWGTEAYFDGHPFLTEEAANCLFRCRAALVGIDSLNIDDTADGRRPVHTALLAAGIPIVEHLTGLDRLPATGFRFFAVPVKVRGLGTFPARAFAVLGR